MFTNLSPKSRLFACAAAAGMMLSLSGNLFGGECGCEIACDACPTVACDCPCDCSRGIKLNCLSKAFNALMDGIDNLLCSESDCCDDMLCDDACDAAMIHELTSPIASPPCRHHSGSPLHQPYTGPTRDLQITPTGPSQWQGAGAAPAIEMSAPKIEPLEDKGQHLGSDVIVEPPRANVPPPVRLPRAGERPLNDPRQDSRDSIFDTLSNPFSDDEARVHTYNPVRPSNYEEQAESGQRAVQPISKKPLSRSYSKSSRRVKSKS